MQGGVENDNNIEDKAEEIKGNIIVRMIENYLRKRVFKKGELNTDEVLLKIKRKRLVLRN